MSRKYICNSTYILKDLFIHIERNLIYERQPIEILDRRDQVLRMKTIPLVEILWKDQSYGESDIGKRRRYANSIPAPVQHS